MKKLTKSKISEIVLKQFEIAGIEGITINTLKETPNWFSVYSYTQEEQDKWKEYLRKELVPYVPKARLENEVSWFVLDYGLKVQ